MPETVLGRYLNDRNTDAAYLLTTCPNKLKLQLCAQVKVAEEG